jgi:hypothetical protein
VAFQIQLALEALVDRLDDLPQRAEQGAPARWGSPLRAGRSSRTPQVASAKDAEQHLGFVGFGAGQRASEPKPSRACSTATVTSSASGSWGTIPLLAATVPGAGAPFSRSSIFTYSAVARCPGWRPPGQRLDVGVATPILDALLNSAIRGPIEPSRPRPLGTDHLGHPRPCCLPRHPRWSRWSRGRVPLGSKWLRLNPLTNSPKGTADARTGHRLHHFA